MKRQTRADGFTLIEVLVAIALLAIAGGVLLAAQGSGSRLARKALERENAIWLAQARLTEAAAYPDHAPPEDNQTDVFEGVNYETRIEYRNVSPVPEIAFADLPETLRLVELRAIVRWGDPVRESVQLTTYRPYAVAQQPAAGAENAAAGKPADNKPALGGKKP